MNQSILRNDSKLPDSVLVVVPTYNEALLVQGVISGVREAVPEAFLLVVDDNSPDGTGALADSLALSDNHIIVLHRPGKQGLGTAYIDGFTWGSGHGFDVLVQMDADGSHRPEDLPRLLAALGHADVVLGSRWVAGAQVLNWPRSRRLISRAGCLYARLALGLPVKDATGGYHVIRASALPLLELETVASTGYAFQIEIIWRAVRAGLPVLEVPITFHDRERGHSKMSAGIIAEALWRVTVWGVGRRGPRWNRPRSPTSSVIPLESPGIPTP
jgi:dolichol-phosphate mannosyltransferase